MMTGPGSIAVPDLGKSTVKQLARDMGMHVIELLATPNPVPSRSTWRHPDLTALIIWMMDGCFLRELAYGALVAALPRGRVTCAIGAVHDIVAGALVLSRRVGCLRLPNQSDAQPLPCERDLTHSAAGLPALCRIETP